MTTAFSGGLAWLAGLAGLELDAGQFKALDAVFMRGQDGQLPTQCRDVDAEVIKAAALAWLFLTAEPLVLWSLPQPSAARGRHHEMDQIILSSQDMARRVGRSTRRNGEESIELRNGARLLFRAGAAGRGLRCRKLIIEGNAGRGELAHRMAAIVPTVVDAPEPQVLYGRL